jgi:MFS family permease
VADTEPETPPQPQEEPAAAVRAEPEAVAIAVAEPIVDTPPPAVEPEPAERLEPVPLRVRMKTAVRIGAWTGAALGVVGFLAASAFWASNATVLAGSGPVVQVNPNTVLVGIALVSVVFGAIVAGVSRAATAWTNPAMQLSGSKAATAWLGAGIGLVLGVVAGAMLNGFGTAVEGSEPAVVQLPVLATLFVMVIGGAVSGALTALVPQVLGVPVAVDESDEEEVATIKRRLGNAMGIPLAGLLLMGLLVLPFAYALIESNHLAPGVGGAVVAIIAASGILGFAALAGTKPEMRISFGDVLVALIGIGVVLVIIISVLFATTGDDHSGEPPEGSAVIRLI